MSLLLENKTHLEVYLTAKSTSDRISKKSNVRFEPCPPVNQLPNENGTPHIFVNPATRFQIIEGFGGAFTESGAHALSRIDPDQRAEVLQAYFHPANGLGYTFCRTHINSCDFSLGNYAYAETPHDRELKKFSIAHDRQLLLPFIKDAQQIAGQPFKLFASPWSPPAWMKTNNQMNHGGKLKDEYRKTWALYYARYIQAYAREGVPIWGITVQNEPEAKQTWDSCLYSAAEERDFVKNFLGPCLEQEGLIRVRIIVHDHNRDHVYDRAAMMLADREAARYIWGTGLHWYVEGENFKNQTRLHAEFPDKFLLFTEGCQEGAPDLTKDNWGLGEKYGHHILNDLNNWTVGWVDWNLVLDEKGGPNHVGNFCHAPVIVDTQTKKVHYLNAFHYVGHFSKFIKQGAQRIGCESTCPALEATAFDNVDGRYAVVVLNRTDNAQPFRLTDRNISANVTSPAHSIMTLVI
jgi:glucosylceramidase